MWGKMKFVISVIFLFQYQVSYASNDSCECVELSCNSCEMQESLEFYTEKCNGGTQIKSCAKPVCVALDPLPKTCTAAKKQPSKRSIASVPVVEDDVTGSDARVEVGVIKTSIGKSWIVSSLGNKVKAKKDLRIYESDKITTSSNGKVKIVFNDANILFVANSSEVKIEEYMASKKKSNRKVLLKLLKGKLRSSVKQKYDNTQASRFQVKTKSAVAGVRGTDFVVELMSNHKYETKVTTLEGLVQFKNSVGSEQVVDVPANHTTSYVVDTSALKGNADSEFVARGSMTPLYKVSGDEVSALIAQLEDKTKTKPISIIKVAEDDSICSQPKADFNMCSWKCENNPRGQKSCRTDLENVKCVRKRCNANGEWVDNFRLPASIGEKCPAYGHKVKDCDY